VVNDLELTPVEVANRMRPVLLRLARELRREVHPLGVTGGQVTLLVQIRRHAGIGVRELASREGISAAGMSGHVARLERAGLIERRADAGDRRRHGLHVSAEGERVLRLVRSRRTAWLSARMKGLSPDELRTLDAAIGPLERVLGEPEGPVQEMAQGG
jgi:DNA-binding MarR family transcriptional regulator